MNKRRQELGQDFAQLLQFYRKQVNLTQVQLAERLGVSPVLISYYERGRRSPKLGTATRLAEVLDLHDQDRENLLASVKSPLRGIPKTTVLLDELTRIFSSPRTSPELKTRLAIDLKAAVDAWHAMQKKTIRWAVVPLAGWQAQLLAIDASARLAARAIAEARRCGIDRSVVVVAPCQKGPLSEALTHLEPTARMERERKLRVAVQGEQLGLGHAIQRARESLPPHEPFALILPDDGTADACLSAMLKIYDEQKCSVVALRKLEAWDGEGYGFVSVQERRGNLCVIHTLTEKPEGKPPEPWLAVLGRYILTPEIFTILEVTPPHPRSGNIELTDALHLLARQQTIYGYLYRGKVHSISPPRRQLMQQLSAFLRD